MGKLMKQIMVDPSQDKFLRRESRRARRSMSLVVRDAIDRYAALAEEDRAPVRPLRQRRTGGAASKEE